MKTGLEKGERISITRAVQSILVGAILVCAVMILLLLAQGVYEVTFV